MVRIFSEVAAYAAAGEAVLLTVGHPKLKKMKLLEIRCVGSITQNTVVRITVNGEVRYDIIPTVADHTYLIEEEMKEATEIVATVVQRTAGAQTVGVSMVVDEEK